MSEIYGSKHNEVEVEEDIDGSKHKDVEVEEDVKADIDVAKHKEVELEKDVEEDLCSELKPELLSIVASDAIVADPGAIANIRSVCKSWNLKDSNIVRYPFPHSIDKLPTQYPCLLSLNGYVCEFFLNNYSFYMEFPELTEAYIRFSKFGWLLLSRGYENQFFFNPFTREKIDIPNNNGRESYISMSFSAPPTSSCCYVIGMAYRRIGIIKRGEVTWSFSLLPEGQRLEFSYSHPVFYENYCYFMGYEGNIVAIDLQKKSSLYFYDISLDLYCHRNFLVENNAGNILAVFVPDEEENNIYIKEIEASNIIKGIENNMWRPIESLEGKMLFVSRTASFIKAAPIRAMSNKIYFPTIRNGSYIFYSLASNKYHSFLGDYSSESPWEIDELSNCTWIEPMAMSTTGASTEEKIRW